MFSLGDLSFKTTFYTCTFFCYLSPCIAHHWSSFIHQVHYHDELWAFEFHLYRALWKALGLHVLFPRWVMGLVYFISLITEDFLLLGSTLVMRDGLIFSFISCHRRNFLSLISITTMGNVKWKERWAMIFPPIRIWCHLSFHSSSKAFPSPIRLLRWVMD